MRKIGKNIIFWLFLYRWPPLKHSFGGGLVSLHSFAFIYICQQTKKLGQPQPKRSFGGGLNSSSGGELKLYLGSTGSTPTGNPGSAPEYITAYCILCGGVCDLFALKAYTYIFFLHTVLGYVTFLHYVHCPPSPYTSYHCILHQSDLFALKTMYPPPYTYIFTAYCMEPAQWTQCRSSHLCVILM